MAVMLKITFTGLFTFVPSVDRKELVVLLPRTGVLSPGNRVHQHLAYVIVERDHETHKPRPPKRHNGCVQKAQSADHPPVMGHHDHADHAGGPEAQGRGGPKNVECIPFGRYRLVFTGLATGSKVDPPAEAFNLTEREGKLDPKQLGSAPDDSVWAQVVLPGATVDPDAGDTANWKMDATGPEIAMSHQVIWKTEVGTGAKIEFWHLGGGKAGELELKPRESDTEISVHIEYLPPKHDRHEGQQCLDAPHFMAYYDLFGKSKEKPLPVLVDVDKVDDKLTCMTSRATTG